MKILLMPHSFTMVLTYLWVKDTLTTMLHAAKMNGYSEGVQATPHQYKKDTKENTPSTTQTRLSKHGHSILNDPAIRVNRSILSTSPEKPVNRSILSELNASQDITNQ